MKLKLWRVWCSASWSDNGYMEWLVAAEVGAALAPPLGARHAAGGLVDTSPAGRDTATR